LIGAITARIGSYASGLHLSVVLLVGLLSACSGIRSAGTEAANRPSPAVSIAVAAQARSLFEARTLLDQDRCDSAARLINRTGAASLGSPSLAEARYLLARCYERQGRLSHALAAYESMASSSSGLDREEVRASIARLRVRPDLASPAGASGVLIDPASLSSKGQLDTWMRQLAGAGATMVIVEAAATPARDPLRGSLRGSSGGVYFETALAPVLRDVIGELLPTARRHGIRVFSALYLDRMDWVMPSSGWHDAQYDVERRDLTMSGQLDLFNPAVREYVSRLLADLAQTGTDGILLRFAGQPMGGFSRHAAEAFERDFHKVLEPTSMLMPLPTTQDIAAASRQEGKRAPSPDYWRWIGWKARERINILERVAAETRRQAPMIQIGLELHPESITAPLTALVQYGEDVLEAKRSSVQFLVIRAGASNHRSSNGPRAERMGEATIGLLTMAREVLGSLDRLWIIRPDTRPLSQGPLRSVEPPGMLPSELGLILDAGVS
jgi:hypothetical protein